MLFVCVVKRQETSLWKKQRSIHFWKLSESVSSCVNKGVTIFLQSLGKAGTSTLLSVLREIVCGVGLVLLLPIWFGLDGLLWFMAISDIITFIASLAVLIYVDKSLQDS